MALGFRTALALLGSSFVASTGREFASQCPDTHSLENLTFNIATMNGKYLGYAADPALNKIGFFDNTSTKMHNFDWAFEACPNTTRYRMKAGTKDGRYVYMHCCPLALECTLAHDVTCDTLLGDPFQVAPLGSNCGLNPWNWGNNMYLCDGKNDQVKVCWGISAASEMIFLPASCAPVTNATGKWVPLTYSNVPSDYAVQIGVEHDYEKDTTSTWSVSATGTLSAGFEMEGGNVGGSVSSTVSHTFSQHWSSTLKMTKTETYTYHLGAGQFWQFQFTFQDRCGRSVAGGYDYVLTRNDVEIPCCLPGFFKNNSEPHGACLKASDGKTYSYCTSESLVVV